MKEADVVLRNGQCLFRTPESRKALLTRAIKYIRMTFGGYQHGNKREFLDDLYSAFPSGSRRCPEGAYGACVGEDVVLRHDARSSTFRRQQVRGHRRQAEADGNVR